MRTSQKQRTSKIIDVLGPLAGPIRGMMRNMDIVEEEIHKVFPTRASEPRSIFLVCMPPQCLRGKHDDLYRSHVRELCLRAKATATFDWLAFLKGDGRAVPEMRRATEAECLALISDTTLQVKPGREALLAFEVLFKRVMGRELDAAHALASPIYHSEAADIIRGMQTMHSADRPVDG